MNVLGENIRKRRKELKMTLAEVSSATGVTEQTLSRYETGAIKNIPSDNIEKIAQMLKTTPSALMGWEYIPPMISEKNIFKNPNVQILFDTAKKVTMEEFEFVYNLMQDINKK